MTDKPFFKGLLCTGCSGHEFPGLSSLPLPKPQIPLGEEHPRGLSTSGWIYRKQAGEEGEYFHILLSIRWKISLGQKSAYAALGTVHVLCIV